MPEYSSEDRSDRSVRTIRTARLQLSFHWGVDRWHHELAVRSGGEWVRVACSFELDPSRDRPGRVTCPAYQQFHHQPGEGRAYALLVGQSGPHHFSASFEVEEDRAASRIRVDVADRVRVEDPWLACTYLAFQSPTAMTVEPPSRIGWDVAGAGRLTLSPAGPADRPSRVVLGELTEVFGPAPAETGASVVPIQVVEDPEPGAPALRCRYLWSLEAVAADHRSRTM